MAVSGMFLQLPTSAAEAQIAPAGAGVPASIHAGVHPVALTAQAHHTGQVARAEQAPIEDAQGSALRSLLTVAQPPAKQAPWWAPIASGVVPGAGQFVLKQQRSAAYAVAEAYLLIQYLGSRRDGNRERDNYRQLAADVARRQFGGSLPVGPWKYYETMESYLESGVYNRTPGQALTPEMDETTYNGNRWRLARDTYWRDPNVEPARSSAEYQRAIEFYEQNAIHDAYRWSWRDARLEQDTYREVIDNANRSYQRGVNYALCNMSCARRIKQSDLNPASLKDRLTANQHTVRLIRQRREQDPKTSEHILEEIGRFAVRRKGKGISMASVANPRPALSLASRLFLLVLLSPYFLACTAISAPTLLITRLICSRMEDRAFHNSIRYVTTFLVWTLTVLVSFFVLFGLVAWEYALAATIVFIPAPLVFYQYYKWFRTARSDFRWLRAGDMRKEKERFVEWIL